MKPQQIFAALFVVTLASNAMAQTTGSQKFKVIVPTNISITPPADATITHDQSENNQAFPAQQWVVKGNTLTGVTVSFATGSAFVHTTDNTFKRNASLGLAVASNQGPATWNVTKASDATDYANADGVATVQAESNGVGRATFNLNVSFVTDGFGSFAAGNYESTVVGTVTAK